MITVLFHGANFSRIEKLERRQLFVRKIVMEEEPVWAVFDVCAKELVAFSTMRGRISDPYGTYDRSQLVANGCDFELVV